MATLENIERLLVEVAKKTNHRNFVIVGSLSILGTAIEPPAAMTWSSDVDLYLKMDPGRQAELLELDEESGIMDRAGCYADPVSPKLISAPDGWESRLIPVSLGSRITAWFMDPNDGAVAKCFRGDERDLRWIRAGLVEGLIHSEAIREGIRKTSHCLPGEVEVALDRLKMLAPSPVLSRGPR